ncbi:MAG: hypothetical protein K2O24_09630 [Muribaculaceae bacterium]|nr:hypothetical protein [Muribaculaceae bacterium]
MTSTLHLTLFTSELLADLRAEGWRVADVLGESSGHLRHQWADICEPGNLQTVARALRLTWAEALALPGLESCPAAETAEAGADHDDLLRLPEKFECLARCHPDAGMLVLLRLHALMVAGALAAFAETLPGSDAALRRTRRSEALEVLRQALAAASPSDDGSASACSFRRKVPPL